MRKDMKIAVLIDAENISSKYADTILKEASGLGNVIYKRIYGNWTSSQLGSWKQELLDHAIQPIQQYSNTSGKNSSDSALIIDAMDLLYQNRLDAFCIVSSDSDFTRLASRLRESEMYVLGMGEQKTPRAFISACNKFVYLDVLAKQKSKRNASKESSPNKHHENTPTEGQTTSKPATPATKQGAETHQKEESRDGTLPRILQSPTARQAATNQNVGRIKQTPLLERATDAPTSKQETSEPSKPSSQTSTPRSNEGNVRIQRMEESAKARAAALERARPSETEETEYEDAYSEGTDIIEVTDALAQIVEDYSDDEGWMPASNLANLLSRRLSDFDTRNFGFKKFVPFVESLKIFEKRSVASVDDPAVSTIYFRLIEE